MVWNRDSLEPIGEFLPEERQPLILLELMFFMGAVLFPQEIDSRDEGGKPLWTLASSTSLHSASPPTGNLISSSW